jgi:PAS domain S-box-containing protein
MTTKPLSAHPLAPLPSWQGEPPGSGEFAAILNSFSDAALLADRQTGQVAFANSGFFELTGIDPLFPGELQVRGILPEFGDGWSSGEEHETKLRLARGRYISVWSSTTWLDKRGHWLLVKLIPIEVYHWRQAQSEREGQWLDALERLAELTNQPELDDALNLALEVGMTLIGASGLGLYRADVQNLRLLRVMTRGESALRLPESLSLEQASAVYAPSIWISGQRAVTDLQDAARISGLSSLVSVPVESNGTRLGLLAATNLPPTNARQLINALGIVAAHIAATLQHYVTLNNMRRSMREASRALAIRDTIAENSMDGVILLNPNLRVIDLNPAAELMLGYATSEALGAPVENILIGMDNLSAGLQMALRGRASPDLGNIKLHRRSGQAFPAHLQVFPVSTAGELTNIVLMVRDASESEEIRARTQQLEQRALLGEITAIFAHEVRNPINNISTGLQLVEMNLPENDPNRELAGRLQNDCQRLTHLMESVLSFAKPLEYQMVKTDLAQVVGALLERWRPRMARLNVELHFKAEENIWPALADARALEQVFTNLVSNALTAMKEAGGTLAVRVEKTEEAGKPWVRVSISDTGPGIPEDLREKVFEPFFTTSPQGTGLGLAITKRIVSAHKGIIRIESFPGGTMFHVLLPCAAPKSGGLETRPTRPENI